MRIDDGIARVEGCLTLAEATRLLAEGEEAIATGCSGFDFSGASQVDSVAVSLILAWQRRAQAQGRTLAFHNLPDSVRSLIDLYGVDDLIPA
jgi:phospholipid transport system transporter-binding protein